jgi:hypothetical protein
VESIGEFCFFGRDPELSSLTFEPGSNLRRLDDSSLFGCPHLRSLCIPASVESIGKGCFEVAPPIDSEEDVFELGLETLSFEPDSKLRRIERQAFFFCSRLRSICLPASLSEISSETFAESNFSTIEIEPGNTHFSVREHFVLDFSGTYIVFYFGTDEEVQIPDEIETIGDEAFSSKDFIRSISFGRESKLRRFGDLSFASCDCLNRLHIPSSVREIGIGAFADCEGLTCVTIEPVSELVRIEDQAFDGCLQLQSISIPASIESIGKSCLTRCWALSVLVFESPSHVRELRSLSGWTNIDSLDIPDSVEVVKG